MNTRPDLFRNPLTFPGRAVAVALGAALTGRQPEALARPGLLPFWQGDATAPTSFFRGQYSGEFVEYQHYIMTVTAPQTNEPNPGEYPPS